MTNHQWKTFFEIGSRFLINGSHNMAFSDSWCSWTTFDRLMASDCGYWTSGFPAKVEIGENHIKDGGVWGQPFHFEELAHIIIPKTFITTLGVKKSQNIASVSEELKKHQIPHSINDSILEVKLY
ncbi:MAG: hypothetical protein CMP47_04010 [Rickettsiales bacterium]|jgi:hypothetical protein|nr:hypothetical protein [Rickettsiales bacterium]